MIPRLRRWFTAISPYLPLLIHIIDEKCSIAISSSKDNILDSHFPDNMPRLAVTAQHEIIWCACSVNWMRIRYNWLQKWYSGFAFQNKHGVEILTNTRLSSMLLWSINASQQQQQQQQMFLSCSSAPQPLFARLHQPISQVLGYETQHVWGVGCKKQGVASLLAWQQRYCFKPPLPEKCAKVKEGEKMPPRCFYVYVYRNIVTDPLHTHLLLGQSGQVNLHTVHTVVVKTMPQTFNKADIQPIPAPLLGEWWPCWTLRVQTSRAHQLPPSKTTQQQQYLR